MNWIREFFAELRFHVRHAWRVLFCDTDALPGLNHRLSMMSWMGALLVIGTAVLFASRVPAHRVVPPLPRADAETVRRRPKLPADLTKPIREVPDRFRAGAKMPRAGEGATSISINEVDFDPEWDLVLVDDGRVWWESDNDKGDTENDHQVHWAMEEPLRRLIELVSEDGGTLKVQDSYRDEGIHASRSLHKQGRAVDLTCDELGLERLASLSWAAGFDWVYYEAPKRGGHHVHASVRPE